jgi:hypothetical protein
MAVLCLVSGCPKDMSSAQDLSVAPDLTATGMDMSVPTECGRPGDTGNARGVGKYCTMQSDCAGQMANICSAIMNTGGPMDTYFCTMQCDPQMIGFCGPDATCLGRNFGGTVLYGCAPNRCVVPGG